MMVSAIRMSGADMNCFPDPLFKSAFVTSFDCTIGTIPAGRTASISVYRNFKAAITCGVVEEQASVDSDATDDEAMNNISDSITVPCNNTNSSQASSSQSSVCTDGQVIFTKAFSLSSLIDQSDQILMMDIDDDGSDDVLSRKNGTITAYTKQTDGSFKLLYSRALGNAYLGNMEIADSDGDGKKEIISITGSLAGDYVVFNLDITDPATGTVKRIYTNDASGNRQSLSFSSVRFGVDINGDIIGIVGNGAIGDVSRITIIGSFANVQKIGNDRNTHIIADKYWGYTHKVMTDADLGKDIYERIGILEIRVVDINGDGTDDLFVKRSEARDVRIQWISGVDGSSHDLGFVLGGAPIVNGQTKKVWEAFSDINKDGLMDIAMTMNNPSGAGDSRFPGAISSATYWMENTGQGLHWDLHMIDSAGSRTGIAIGDWNNDKNPDVITSGWPVFFYGLEKDCSGTVQPVFSF